MKNPTAEEKARQFLRIADQFQLGRLVTESPHPRDRDLSDTAKTDLPGALAQLFDVDKDVLSFYRRWAESGAAAETADAVTDALRNGGKLFFTGCGATGRLSIQLAAMWRDFWQRRAGDSPEAAKVFEKRAFSVMAGGDFALIKSVEGFEDYAQFGRKQISDLGVAAGDVVFAITEGGETSFVIGTAWAGLEAGAKVFFVYNNPDDILRETVERSREVIEEPRIQKINLTTGPMAITGSTWMQATSAQLCVMTTILEMVLRRLTAEAVGESVDEAAWRAIPAQTADALEARLATLASPATRAALAKLVEREEAVYRARRRNNYFSDRLAIDVLTDTTERSPTFCLPAFKKFDDNEAAESWSFLFLPRESTEEAWGHLLKRELQPVEWDGDTIRSLIGEEDAERQERIMRAISRREILRFRIGLDGLAHRPCRKGDTATAILTEEEIPQLTEENGFYRRQLENAHQSGAETAVILFAGEAGLGRVEAFLHKWSVPALVIPVTAPANGLLLEAPVRVCAKMLLNALSTLTMVRMGRVMGNVMIWVVPSNLKLIDRSIRYIQNFTQLDYEAACILLHRAIEYVTPRMQAGKEYPSTVGLCVIATRDNCPFEEAEETLLRELG